jgi:glycosyltransferase involved in cell wall biosynthesis
MPRPAAGKVVMKCTVLIPAYNRIPTLLELIERLRKQDYPDFDILVIEQSTHPAPEDRARLDAMAAEDPRLRVEYHPPLGVGGARNAGMPVADGEVVLMIDDDDLPVSDDWISQHMKNYADPNCIAVHGGERREDGAGGVFERRFPELAYRFAMSYSPFGTPMAFPGVKRRKEGCAYLRGTNSSIRRQWALDAGGWVDECNNGQEEHDFSFRLRKLMRPGQYIVFDPTARIVRRMHIPGGAERRTGTLARDIEGNIRFYFGVIPRHWRIRGKLLAPIFPAIILGRSIGWILDDRAHEPASQQALALSYLAVAFPFLMARGFLRFARDPSGATVRPAASRPPAR